MGTLLTVMSLLINDINDRLKYYKIYLLTGNKSDELSPSSSLPISSYVSTNSNKIQHFNKYSIDTLYRISKTTDTYKRKLKKQKIILNKD